MQRQSDTNIQEPLYSRTVQRRHIFSSSTIGDTFKAGNNQSKPAQEIKNPSPHLSIYSHLQGI